MEQEKLISKPDGHLSVKGEEGWVERKRKYEERREEIRRLEEDIRRLEKAEEGEENIDTLGEVVADEKRTEGVVVEAEPDLLSVQRIITDTTSLEERQEIEIEFPNQPIHEIIAEETLKALNDKAPIPTFTQGRQKTTLEKVARKTRRAFLVLFAFCNLGINTSFVFPKSAEARTYDNVEVTSLENWENIKLYQDDINKLENVNIIIEAHKNLEEKYMIVDKPVGLAHLYQSDSLISTYEVGVGQNIGDDQTKTVVRDGVAFWEEGNKQTGAGIYKVNNRGRFNGAPSFTMINERGIEVPTAFHRATQSRNRFFNNKNANDNRMSNGCFNFQARSLEDLARQKGFGKGTKVYILPDDPHNKFQIVDGELRFLSSNPEVNRTIRPYLPKPIILRAENVNKHGKLFLQTIADSKPALMNLYPTVSNDVYNQLTRIAYGIFGQESSFGTYGRIRGQRGRVTDYAGTALHKNVSVGVTQIRLTSVRPEIRNIFNIHQTRDLLNLRKAGVATMSLLLDIYTTNIPRNQLENYEELVPLYYNNPNDARVVMRSKSEINSIYVNRVRNYGERVSVYLAR